jgi:hypothetical protein
VHGNEFSIFRLYGGKSNKGHCHSFGSCKKPKSSCRNVLKIAGGAYLGLATGVLLGVFFAQKSGQELRTDLQKSDNKVKTFVLEMIAIKKAAFMSLFEGTKKFISERF